MSNISLEKSSDKIKMNIRRIKLTVEERSLIHEIMREKGTNQSKIGKLIGNDSAAMSRKLGKGDISLTFNEASGIYIALGEDDRLRFLLQPDLPEDPRRILSGYKSLREKSWENLFINYVNPIQRTYLNSPPEIRAGILGDLERLMDKYVPVIPKETQ